MANCIIIIIVNLSCIISTTIMAFRCLVEDCLIQIKVAINLKNFNDVKHIIKHGKF